MSTQMSVVGSRHKLNKLNKHWFVLERRKKSRSNQSYHIDYVLERNANFKENGEIIDIDWNSTFKKCADASKDRYMSMIKKAIRKLMVDAKLPTNESYLSLLEDQIIPIESINGYIGWLEITLKDLEASNDKPEKDIRSLEDLQLEYKELKGEEAHHKSGKDKLVRDIDELKTVKA